MLSNRFIVTFFFGAIVLAWLIPSSWITQGLLPTTIPHSPESPWRGTVSLDDVAWGNGSPYVRISVGALPSPITISQWSLENERGERSEIGMGVETLNTKEPPSLVPITVASNTSLLVSFGPSPLGVSFREHLCSAYLRGTTPFTPPMEAQCPDLSRRPEWNTLDGTCKLLIESLPRCTVISPEHLGEVTPKCESFLRSVPNYASCIKEVGTTAVLPRWRIFADKRETFIHKEGGTVVLRDDRGMIVDVLPYDTIGLK